jgi:hypothetical protein
MATLVIPNATAAPAGSTGATSTSLVDQSTTVWDYSAGNIATWTAGASRVLQLNNLPSGPCSGLLFFVQGGSGGYTPALGGVNSTGFAIAQAVGAVTLLDFTKIGNVLYWNSTPYGAVSTTPSQPAPTGTTQAQVTSGVQNFFARNSAGDGVLSQTAKDGYTKMVNDIFAAGLYDKLYEFWPFIGSSAGSHSLGAKGIRDLTFQNGWLHTATGSQPDPASPSPSYARTGVYPTTIFDVFNASLGYYSRTQTTDSGDVLSSVDASTSSMRMVIRDQNTDRFFTEIGSPQQRIDSGTAGANSTGFFVSNRANANLLTAYRNGTVIGTQTTGSTGNLPSGEMFLNALSKAGVPSNYSRNECAFAYLGYGLSDAQVATLSSIVQTFQTAIGRAV